MEIYSTNHGDVFLKSLFSEITLDEYISFLESESKKILKTHEIEDFIFEHEELLDQPPIDDPEAQEILNEYEGLLLDLSTKLRDQLLVFVPDDDSVSEGRVLRMNSEELLDLGAQFILENDVSEDEKVNLYFTYRAATKELVDELIQERKHYSPLLDRKEYRAMTRRIKRLKAGHLVMLPVQDAVFATKINTDKDRRKLPSMPEEIVQAYKDIANEKDFNPQEFLKLTVEGLDKQKELQQWKRRLLMYYRKLTEEQYRIAIDILAELVVPIGEEYDPKQVERQKKVFGGLSMAQVQPLLDFFLLVQQISKKSSQFSIPIWKVAQVPRRRKRERTI